VIRNFLFLFVCIFLLIVWFLSWVAFHVASGLIHIVLVLALLALVLQFVQGRRV